MFGMPSQTELNVWRLISLSLCITLVSFAVLIPRGMLPNTFPVIAKDMAHDEHQASSNELPQPVRGPMKASDCRGVRRAPDAGLAYVQMNADPLLTMAVYNSSDIVSSVLITGNVWERWELDQIRWALSAQLPAGANPTSTDGRALFVDIGANVGAFTLKMASEGFEVIAFEAMTANQEALLQSMCASGPAVMSYITLHPVGLGAEDQTCFIYSGLINRGDGIVMCGEKDEAAAAKKIPSDYAMRGTFELKRLDDIVQRDVQVIKIDVEGYEPFVFAGAQNLLRKHKVWFIMAEYNQNMLHTAATALGKPIHDFVLTLASLGYRVSPKSFQGPFFDQSQINALEHKNASMPLENLYFVHPDFPLGAPVRKMKRQMRRRL